MTDNREHIEYELIDIAFELPYVLPEDDIVVYVREDGSVQESDSPKIEYDQCGIPYGYSKQEIKIREKIIKDFYSQWISQHQDKKVWNNNLNDYIHVKFLSINETYSKAARSHESTKAVFNLTNILENAQLIAEMPPKQNNKNQKRFSKILQMRYGKIKLIVGYQKVTGEHVQYSITSPQK